jgi:hypothetical protein
MVSTRRLSQAERVAPNARLRADGGFIFADARNAVTSAAAIVHQVSMRQSTTPLRVIRLSQASSRASTGFTIIAPRNPSPARSFLRLSAIRWISRRRDRTERCRQTGKRCFTNKGRLFWFPISGSQGPVRESDRWRYVEAHRQVVAGFHQYREFRPQQMRRRILAPGRKLRI